MKAENGPAKSPWWERQSHADRRPRLKARGSILRSLRHFFEVQGFVEVDTAILQVSPGNETHISGFGTELVGPDERRTQVYLHSSPEFACKKLLAAGEERLFTFAHVFRNRDRSPLHHPEFTMLEWYRAGASYLDLINDCHALLVAAADAIGANDMSWRGRTADPRLAPEWLSVADAFERYAGLDLMATLHDDGTPDRARLASSVAHLDLRIAADDTWSDLFSKVLSGWVEPHLGLGRPTILMDYPVCEAALARRSPADPRVAERFELYACGVELANAFGELTDPGEQRARFVDDMEARAAIYGEAERYPLDEDFLDALAHMPEAAGIALGFDRLVMLLTGANRIEDVLWTPVVEVGA